MERPEILCVDSLPMMFGRSSCPISSTAAGRKADLEHILELSRQGQKILHRQQYEIVSEMAQDDGVAVEARWTEVLAMTVGTLATRTEMKTSFAMFFRFRDGRIAVQRN